MDFINWDNTSLQWTVFRGDQQNIHLPFAAAAETTQLYLAEVVDVVQRVSSRIEIGRFIKFPGHKQERPQSDLLHRFVSSVDLREV